MKNLLLLLGVITLVAGIGLFAFKDFSYQEREKVADFGPIQITKESEKQLPFSQNTAIALMAGGAVLLIAGGLIKQ